MPRFAYPALIASLLSLRLLAGSEAADPATLRAQADTLRAAGIAAMAESSTTSSRAVDAALIFNRLLAIDRALGDVDDECDTEANLFWCKKHMNVDELKSYVARKDTDQKELVATVKIPAAADTEKAVSADEAETYFKRAQAYATEHADRQFQIAVRYFEVAERFQGTPFAIEAQRLSLEAQQRSMTQDTHRTADSLFTKPAVTVDNSARQPVPAADALKTATATIKDTFKEDFAQIHRAKRGTLANKLMTQAQATTDDPTMRYALLEQARDLAISLNDPVDVMAAVDRLAASFVGIEAASAKKQALARVHGQPAAQAMAKLLDNPEDPEANAIAGRYVAFDLQQWPLALPLLQRGNDAALKKLADMELSNPAAAARQAEIGDGWYELSRKAPEAAKDAIYAHALSWYHQADAGLVGMSKTAAARHVTEIMGLILMEGITDWANLTPTQWERVHSPVMEVAVGKVKNDVPAQDLPAPPYRILAQPVDTWHVQIAGQDVAVTWKGDAQRTVAGFQAGELLMTIGAEKPQRIGDVGNAQALALLAATTQGVATGLGGGPGGGGGGGRRGGGGFGGGGLFGTIVNPHNGVIRVKFMAINEP